jgi:hypothetical protein
MNACDECGLPLNICTALTIYREAYETYEKGDVATARQHSNKAQVLIVECRTTSAKIGKCTLSDEERFALSRL